MVIGLMLAVFGLVAFIMLAMTRTLAKSDVYEQRLRQLQNKDNQHLKQPTSARLELIPNVIGLIARIFAARSYTEAVQIKLIRAGIMLKGEEYITICLLGLITVPGLIGVLTHNLWLSLCLLVLGSLIPRTYLNHRKEQRTAALNQQLGDALVVMANSLRAGFGFQQAMDMVRKELPAPISSEFTWTIREMNLGFSQEEALLNMGKRVDSDNLNMVTTAILIQRQVGGNLAEILDNISNTIRERARLKREIKILTAQGRLSGLIIGLLPVALVLAMMALNPDYIGLLFKDPRGLVLLATGGFMMLTGILLIRKIIQIDY